MSGLQNPKKQRNKPSKSRPIATSSISQPAVEDAWSSAVLSAFSPDAHLFAFLSLAVDKHRLRVFDANTNQSIAEHIVDRARVTSLSWIRHAAIDHGIATDNEVLPPRKRKKFDSTVEDLQENAGLATEAQIEQVVALGLSDGSVQLFSVAHNHVFKTFTDANSKSSVLAIAEDRFRRTENQAIWASSTDGTVRLWDIGSTKVLFVARSGGTPYSVLSVRPGLHDNQTHILAAHNTIRLLSFPSDSTSSDDSGSEGLEEVCSFGGHASAVKSLLWETSSSPSRRFYSSAEDDRFIYLWEVSEPASNRGDLIASCSLDADVRQIDVFSSPGRQILLALSSSGKITLYPIPAELGLSTISDVSVKKQLPALPPRAVVNISKKVSSDIRIAAVTFLCNEPGKIRIALVSGGVRLAFETLEYLDGTGEFIPNMVLEPSASVFGVGKGTSSVISKIANKRYNEPSGITVATGTEIPHDATLDAMADHGMEGNLDANLAELSLGQRLAARTDIVSGSGTSYERTLSGRDTENGQLNGVSERERLQVQRAQVPAHSLTRTLIQALHAGDTSLLEACLSHSDETLIRNTVTRLPSQLSVPLLTACVERLGRGPRGNNIKGRGGGASAQRGLSLMKWARAVLVIHSGHLMTMPDLVARLSHLYSTLTTRLILQDRLLSLSGRLDLVLAQVELRSSNTPAPLASKRQKSRKRGKAIKEPLKYIEGESSDEDEDGDEDGDEDDKMPIEVEEDHDVSVEDVDLDEASEEENEEDEGDSEEDEEDDANLIDGFVDDEAEEDYDEDESEEDSD